MADAKKCDRCDKLYEIYDGIPITAMGTGLKYSKLQLVAGESITKKYDLCPTCMTQVVAFLNNHKVRDVVGEPRSCKTCKYNGMNLDVCMGCTPDVYEMWKEKSDE